MVDGDTFFTHSSLANFFLILEKKLPIGPPVDQAFCVFSRRQLPVAQTFRKPSVTELDQYLARNRAALKMDPLMAGIGAPAGGVVMHHSLWEHSRAYEQTLIWWGWQDIQLHLRMTQRYPWVDLANFGVDMVHLEHYTDPRRQTQKPMNPMNASPVFEANDANWGLANYDLATARSECLLPEEGLSPPPHVPGTVGSWPCSIKQLTEQYQSEQTRQLVSQVASRCEVPSDEVQALFALAWYALHHHPRTFIEVGAKQGYAAAVVAAGCPGVEIFSIESWQNNISPSTTANVIGFFGQNQSYTRHVSGDPSTAVDRLFSSPFAPETFDLALLRTGPALGDARKNAEELAKRLAAGGTMVVVASTPGAFDPIWQMLQSGYKQFTFVQFSPIGGMMIAAPLVIDTPDAIAAATLQQPAPESAPTGAPAR
jgi:predicted O-methyltransferase YrrM